MEVHHTAALELRHLHVGDAHLRACDFLRNADLAGKLALDIRPRAAEQPPSVVVPQGGGDGERNAEQQRVDVGVVPEAARYAAEPAVGD